MDTQYGKIQVAAFYDELSGTWDKTRPEYTEEIFKKILSHLEKSRQYPILDFGCGTGLLCKYLHKHLPEAKIDGIDVSSRMIEKAKTNCPDCNFHVGDILTANLSHYDVIVSKDVFNHIEDVRKILSRLDELLDNPGKIIIANRERDTGVKHNIIDSLRQLGYRISTEHFSFKPAQEEIDTFMEGFSAFKEEHQAFIRKKLEESGDYYIILAE